MSGQQPEIFVDGRPLTSLAYWGDLEIHDQWPLGCWEASWSMPLDPWQRYPQVRDEKPVEIRIGPRRLFAGNLADIDWDSGRMVAVGACRQGEAALCLAADGTTTSIPDTAVDRAIGRGALTWTRPASISATAYGEAPETDELNYVGALLDSYAVSVSKRWYVDAERSLRLAADPVAPTALVINDSGVLGTSDEKKAGRVFGRYRTTNGTLATTSYGSGTPEIGVSWLTLGSMSAAKAQGLCQGIWSQLQGLTGWTNGITVQSGQLMTLGGQQLPLWAFRAGPTGMVRLLGVRDERGLSANTDVVIGESVWKPGEDSLSLTPVGAAARDIGSIIESSGGVLL